MPQTLPEGVVSGVLKSGWASTQAMARRRSGRARRRPAMAPAWGAAVAAENQQPLPVRDRRGDHGGLAGQEFGDEGPVPGPRVGVGPEAGLAGQVAVIPKIEARLPEPAQGPPAAPPRRGP